jgi:hypothetical protein
MGFEDWDSFDQIPIFFNLPYELFQIVGYEPGNHLGSVDFEILHLCYDLQASRVQGMSRILLCFEENHVPGFLKCLFALFSLTRLA